MGFRVGRLSCAATRIPEEWLSTTEPGLTADSYLALTRGFNGVEATPDLSVQRRTLCAKPIKQNKKKNNSGIALRAD
jgi:hypothetical protein